MEYVLIRLIEMIAPYDHVVLYVGENGKPYLRLVPRAWNLAVAFGKSVHV
jgi:hypothetical protein